MSRPITERKIHFTSPSRVFVPRGLPAREQDQVSLSRDEAEAIRLADLEGLYQQAAALRMGISRPTFGRIIECAHRKVADALINGKRLLIEGGELLPAQEDEVPLRIALPTRADQVDEHFGHCSFFTVYSFGKDGKLESEERIEAPDGCACKSGLPARLGQMGVTHLVACHVGQGAAGVLRSYGITVVRGACGSTKEAAESFISEYLSGRAKTGDLEKGGPGGD
jgi:predicted DNA-binding protein (UPF0251 family)/predicted Fe-Mo cluster-binding NifX family protein